MSDEQELEQRLRSRRLPSPAAALRESVLRSVADELQQTSSARRRPWGLAVAACLLLSLALNVATSAVVERRIAAYLAVEGIRSDNLADAAHDPMLAGGIVHGLARSPWLSRFAGQPRQPSLDEYQAYLATLSTGGHWGDVDPRSMP